MRFAKIGTTLYILWGLLHVAAASDEFMLGKELESGIVQGKIYQGAWNLLFIAIFSILIAARYNWRNSRMGYWLNLVLVSVADIGFIIFVLIPGHVDVFPAILGPVFWISAAFFSTLGIRKEPTS